MAEVLFFAINSLPEFYNFKYDTYEHQKLNQLKISTKLPCEPFLATIIRNTIYQFANNVSILGLSSSV